MAVRRPIKEERRYSNARTTKSTYTKGHTTDGYIDSQARPNQLTAYNQLYSKYKDDLRVYQKQKQAINDISNYIICTTSVAYLPLINGIDTVYKRL